MSASHGNLFGFDTSFEASFSDDCSGKINISSLFYEDGNVTDGVDACFKASPSSSDDATNYIVDLSMEPTPFGPSGAVNSSSFSFLLPSILSEMNSTTQSCAERKRCISFNERQSNPISPHLFANAMNHHTINCQIDNEHSGRIPVTNKRCNPTSDVVTISTIFVDENCSSDPSIDFPPMKRHRPLPFGTSSKGAKPESMISSFCSDKNFAYNKITGHATKMVPRKPEVSTIVRLDDISSVVGKDERQERFRIYRNNHWNEKFAELVGYSAKNGHCIVAHNCPESPALAQWVKR